MNAEALAVALLLVGGAMTIMGLLRSLAEEFHRAYKGDDDEPILHSWQAGDEEFRIRQTPEDGLTVDTLVNDTWCEISPVHAGPHVLRELVRVAETKVSEDFVRGVRAALHSGGTIQDLEALLEWAERAVAAEQDNNDA